MSKFGFDPDQYRDTLAQTGAARQVARVIDDALRQSGALDEPVPVTIFHNTWCINASRFKKPWGDICNMLREPDIISGGKLSAPMIKLAVFGDERKPNQSQPDPNQWSLKHDGNVLKATGIEGDYDAGVMSMEEAVRLLEKAGIRAVLYSSWGDGLIEPPKYLGGPRWRVLAPFSRELPPGQRAQMVARLNGALGGVLADESFTLSQGFFIGARPGGDYKCKVTFQDPYGGAPIDTLDTLDEIALHKRNFSNDDVGDEKYSVEIRPGSVIVAPETYAELRAALSVIPADCDNFEWFSVLRGLSRLSNTMEAKSMARDWSTSSPNPEHNEAVFNKEWARMSRENTTISHRKVLWLAKQHDPEWNKGAVTTLLKKSTLENFVLPPLTIQELGAAELHPRIILSHMLYADVRTRISAGGVGKTTLAMFEAVTLALGRELWGRQPDAPVRAVVVTREDTREILVARMREIMKEMNLNAEDVNRVLTNINVVDLSGVSYRISEVVGDVVQPHIKNLDWLMKLLKEFRPDWLIMDPMVSFGVGEQRVNDAEQGLIEAMRILKAEFTCCVEGIHHSGKANAREKTLDQYSGRGGSAMADGSRMVCVMQPLTAQEWSDATGTWLDEGESGIVMAMPKMSYCRAQEPIYVKRKGYSFTQVKPLVAPSMTEVQKQQDDMVLEVIKEAWFKNQPLTMQVLKDEYKALFYDSMKRDAVTAALGRLKRDGLVVQHDTKGGRGQRSSLEPVILKEDEISRYALPSGGSDKLSENSAA